MAGAKEAERARMIMRQLSPPPDLPFRVKRSAASVQRHGVPAWLGRRARLEMSESGLAPRQFRG